MIVTRDKYPTLAEALLLIECDSGGHLIGRVYPGEAIDLEHFKVPSAWEHLVAGAELGLSHLDSVEFETFVIGDQDIADKIEKRQDNLSEARILLNAYFDGWPEDETPFALTSTVRE